MKFIKENGAYLILALFALVLIYFAIVIELSIRNNQSATVSDSRSLWRILPQPLADLFLSTPQAPTVTSGSTSVTVILPQPTATAVPLIVQVTLPPTPVPATSTPLLPTATPSPLLTETPTTVAAAPVDLRIGYVQRVRDCTAMTEVVSQLLQTHFQVTVATQMYDSAVGLFDALAAREVDFTLCYTDPEDRALMRDRLGLIRQIGVQHFVGADYKLQIWANGTAKADLRDQQRCILDFLEKVDFTNQNLAAQAVSQWLQDQQALVNTWLNCPF